jgi:hypothetical protein
METRSESMSASEGAGGMLNPPGTLALFVLEESDRQLSLLALATLALERPGFDDALGRIAGRLQGLALYEDFKAANADKFRRRHPASFHDGESWFVHDLDDDPPQLPPGAVGTLSWPDLDRPGVGPRPSATPGAAGTDPPEIAIEIEVDP